MDVEPKIGGKHAPQNGWLKKKMEEKPIKTGCFGGFPHIFGSTPGYVGFIPQEHPSEGWTVGILDGKHIQSLKVERAYTGILQES